MSRDTFAPSLLSRVGAVLGLSAVVTLALFTAPTAAGAAPLLAVPVAAAAGVTIPSSLTLGLSLGGIGVVEGAVHYDDQIKGAARSTADGVMWGIEGSADLYAGAALFGARSVGLAWNWATGKGPGGDVNDWDPPPPAVEAGVENNIGWKFANGTVAQANDGTYPTNASGCIGTCFGPYEIQNTDTMQYYTVSASSGVVPSPAGSYAASSTRVTTSLVINPPWPSSHRGRWGAGTMVKKWCHNLSNPGGPQTSAGEIQTPGTNYYTTGVLRSVVDVVIDCPAGTGFDHVAIRPPQGYPTAFYFPSGPQGLRRPGGAPAGPTVPDRHHADHHDAQVEVLGRLDGLGKADHVHRATPGSDLPLMVFPACPAGSTRTGADAPTIDGGGPGAVAGVRRGRPRSCPDAYAECNPALGKTCVLVLTRTSPDGSTVTCNVTGLCVGWSTNLTPEVVATGHRHRDPTPARRVDPAGPAAG